jgi:hypothetical protein
MAVLYIRFHSVVLCFTLLKYNFQFMIKTNVAESLQGRLEIYLLICCKSDFQYRGNKEVPLDGTLLDLICVGLLMSATLVINIL